MLTETSQELGATLTVSPAALPMTGHQQSAPAAGPTPAPSPTFIAITPPIFRIVIDTREQEPYSFSCQTAKKKLIAGDYSVEGLEHLVAVERTSLHDFESTVMHDWRRFSAELDILGSRRHACVVVKADMATVLRGFDFEEVPGRRQTRAHPLSVVGAAISVCVRQRIPVYWCGDRQAARWFTEHWLRCAAAQIAREGN